MEKITIEKLIEAVESYNPDEVDLVKRVYEYANELHKNQTRESGEPYITHPLSVAYILTQMHADGATICAGLLHDTIEDVGSSVSEITRKFGQEIATLVDGVTKIEREAFETKEEQNNANTKKIIASTTKDVRIIIVKLADRLHNMRTLYHKKNTEKRKENALETMEIYVPLAYNLGLYNLKSELEDISFKYLYPERYNEIFRLKEKLEETSQNKLERMRENIKSILDKNGIKNEITYRTKSIYGIYSRLEEGKKLSDIHDLFSIKIKVENLNDCYNVLCQVHELYQPMHYRFKDYLHVGKTNGYKSLHTTVFSPENTLVQIQIRTHEMDKIATQGVTAYWDSEKGNAKYTMQNDLKKYQFYKSLTDIIESTSTNKDFVEAAKSELFTKKIYVYTKEGRLIELPYEATVIDFAYKLSKDIGDITMGAVVNNTMVTPEYVLQDKDVVEVITDNMSYGPRREWILHAKTSGAKRRIREITNSY